MTEWEDVTPRVNLEAEFWETANDFGDPLELLREAISNSVDAGASWIRIQFFVEEIEGANSLVIEIEDDGRGMTRDVLAQDFWGLGFSPSRQDKDKIGEKGHGTKIYLRSERVIVRTQTETDATESICDRPMRALATRKSHTPRIRPTKKYQDHSGTFIRIEDYNKSERSAFVQDRVKDYLLWFTKVGSIERMFGVEKLSRFKVFLKCLDVDDFQEIPFGHFFPEENYDIQKLFDALNTEAGDWFCKQYRWKNRLEQLPDVTFEAVISVEGDRVKRGYNPMIRERARSESGKYKVADRYGIWLCKDFIPIQQVNEWISGFGTGSNSFVLLHGFVNCQTLKLTANRGSIANTDPKIMMELQKTVQHLVAEIDIDLNKNGLYTLLQWQSESRTLDQEKAEFDRRTKAVEKRGARFDGRLFLEPQSESELFGLFIAIYAIRPDIFEFEPLDYNTTRGIDIIARNKTKDNVADSTFWYVELKYYLKGSFNHAFKNLRWIVCWDFEKNIRADSEFKSIEETDVRRLQMHKDPNGKTSYFLENPAKANRIQVIRLAQFLKENLEMEFRDEAT